MEPRSIDRGKARHWAAFFELVMLQWSRVRLNVESGFTPVALVSCLEASMEPRSFERGKRPQGQDGRRAVCASMEPRSFERGKREKLSAMTPVA